MDYRRLLYLLTLAALMVFVSCQQGASEGEAEMEHASDMESAMGEMEQSSMGEGMEHGESHSDHNPRHGGIFFMALDMTHHLEGTLTEPGRVTIYLYDEFTRVLPAERTEQTRGTVHWGEFPDPPGMPLEVGPEPGSVVADLDREPEFPVTLTLMLRFPGMGADADPELFTFVFDEYSHAEDH